LERTLNRKPIVMVKPLPLRDFRALRHVLEDSDYGLVRRTRRGRSFRDRIDEDTWRGIWTLPDSVAIQTSNIFGTILRDVHSLSEAWSLLFHPLGDVSLPLTEAALDAGDAFDGAAFCAVVGYYRLAFTSLRAVVENLCIALHAELFASSADKKHTQWFTGNKEMKFGDAACLLPDDPGVVRLETTLRRRIGNDLFRQKQRAPQRQQAAGHARMLFDSLSKFAHARPDYTDAALRGGSNGPVFESQTFLNWGSAFVGTYALALVLLRLGRPNLDRLEDKRDPSVRKLFDSAVSMLPSRVALRSVLRAVPARFW
jgi:hypothetical protein